MSTATRVRPLTRVEHDAFRLARLVAAERMPYFMAALFAAHPLAAEGLGTFAVDRHWRLYMDPALLLGDDAWPKPIAGCVLLHEVGHLIRDHAGRASALDQPHHHKVWNLAGDAEINDDLLAAGADLPDDPITPEALGLPPNGLAEDYYARLLPTEEQEAPGAAREADDDGCGSGSGGAPVSAEVGVDATLRGADDDGCGSGSGGAVPAVSEAEAVMVRRRVARSVHDHAQAKGRGDVPAGLSRWADDTLAPPTVPWARLLRARVRRAIARYAGRTDYTYSRPSRRHIRGVITPSMRGPRVTVSVVIDTSGSMSQADLTAAMSEIAGVLSSAGIDRDHLRLLSCDADATRARPVRSIADVELTGGGGTDMRVGIAAALAARPQPHVVIVLTDGYTPWPETPTRAALICGVITDHEPPPTPPWAATVTIPPAA